MELLDDPISHLAASVLRQATRDKSFDSTTMLTFWCDVVGVNPASFFDRAKKGAVV